MRTHCPKVYLMILYMANDRFVRNNELKRMWDEAEWPISRYYA